jgi:flagellar basal body-associated protein FliL
MAEEEILQQPAPTAKKKGGGGGGVSFVQVIIICVVLVVVTVICMTFVKNGLTGSLGGLTTEVKKIGENQNNEKMLGPDRNPFADCSSIVKLQDKPLIVNLADGQHYLSTDVSICLDKDYKPEGKLKVEDVFIANQAKVIYACNEYLSTLTMAELFPGGAGAPAAATKVQGANGELTLEGETSTAPSFSKQMDVERGKLIKVLRQERGLTFVADVYFTSFLVQ